MSDLANQAAQSEPAFQLHLQARVSGGELHFATDNLADMARVMSFFNLVPAAPNGIEVSDGGKADKAAAEGNGGKGKGGKATKAETAASTAATPAGSTEAKAPAPAASAQPAATGSATPEQAAQAVREYGAKNGIDQARALLKKHGCEKTAEITAEKAPAIFAEATGVAQTAEEL